MERGCAFGAGVCTNSIPLFCSRDHGSSVYIFFINDVESMVGDNFTSALHFPIVVVIVVPAMHEDRRSR